MKRVEVWSILSIDDIYAMNGLVLIVILQVNYPSVFTVELSKQM